MKKKLFSLVLAVLTIVSCMMFVACKPEEAKKYTVSFETFGGTIIESQIVEENKKITCPVDPEKANDLFYHWYLDNQNIPFDFETYKVKGDITIKARWAFSHTVTYKVGDETFLYQQIMDKNLATRPTENPTKENYFFVYWHLENEDGPFDFQTSIEKATTLKAKFVQGKVEQNQVKFYYGDFSRKVYVTTANLPSMVTANAGDEIQLPVIKPTSSSGDEFYGWVNATTGEKYLLANYSSQSDYKIAYNGEPLVLYAIGYTAPNIIV